MTSQTNIDRTLDLLWKRFYDQVARTAKYTERITIVLGSSVGAVGLMLRLNQPSEHNSLLSVSVLSLMMAFVFAIIAWWPRPAPFPGETDSKELWDHLIDQDNNASAANLFQDICLATDLEQKLTKKIAVFCMLCMVCCGVSVLSAICSYV